MLVTLLAGYEKDGSMIDVIARGEYIQDVHGLINNNIYKIGLEMKNHDRYVAYFKDEQSARNYLYTIFEAMEPNPEHNRRLADGYRFGIITDELN